eukprot:jgi/Botrbrau1/16845/Bobra.150_2s0067.1
MTFSLLRSSRLPFRRALVEGRRPRSVRSVRPEVNSFMAPYTLYTAGTPNGWKASITLEELGVPYDVHSIDFKKNEQKEEWFLKINPNGRIPALVDHEAGDKAIFESGAIMWYLASKHADSGLWPKELTQQAETMSWLMFQMGGIGPMQGQANHFLRDAPEKDEICIHRYLNETKRLYGVLEQQLKDHEYLANDTYSIADIANFSWVACHGWAGLSLDDFPHVEAWVNRISKRPAVQKGMDVPEPSKLKDALNNPELAKQMIEEARKMMISTKPS